MNRMIAFCGLDCEKCDAYIATKNDDQALREKTARWNTHQTCQICKILHKWAEYNIVYFAVQCIFITFAAKYNQYEYSCRTSVSAWNVSGTEQEAGVQIVLLIQRDDNIVNLCEMKFYGTPLPIDKEEETKMLYRV